MADVSHLHVPTRKVLCEERDDNKFGKVGWLKGKEAKIKPAFGALDGISDYEHETQQTDNSEVPRNNYRRAANESKVSGCGDKICGDTDTYPYKLSWCQ
jgi:hypothetical protein